MKPVASPTNQKIGETRLVRAPVLEKKLNFSEIYLKLEQDNPTHTHKDRSAHLITNEAKQKGYVGVTIGTCGNFGVSIAYFCKKLQLRSYLFIPRSYKISRLKEMQTYGASIQFVDGTYEDAVEASIKHSQLNGLFDANPHGRGALLAVRGYKEIVNEIYNDLNLSPDTIWIPVGNGTLLTGVFTGLSELGVSSKLGAVSSKGNNAIIESFICRRSVKLLATSLSGTEVNEPLLNWKPTQLKESLLALEKTNGFAYGATDRELVKAKTLLEKYESIFTTPASASALAGFISYKNRLSKTDTHVIVLTN